jgi:MFS family permease
MADSASHRPSGEFYGWLIVAICFVVLSVSFSARFVLSPAMPYLEADLGWSRSFVSLGGSLALVAMAIVAPIAGNVVDRFGPRMLLAAGLATIGVGMAATAAMEVRWQFIVAFSLIAGMGFGMAANHIVSTVVSLQFERNRGLAVGIATSGSTAGLLVLAPLIATMLDEIGWRGSYLVLGAVSLVLILPILLLIRARRTPVKGSRPSLAAAESIWWRLGLLLRSPVFHLLFWSFTICGFTTAGVIEGHLIPYAIACGYPPLESATAYGVLSGFNLLGMVLAGWLTDRMHRPLLLGGIYIMRGLSFILLMYIADDPALLFIFAVAFGLFDYSTVPVTASLVASHIGLRIMGLTMGILSAGHSLGAAVGLFLAGRIFDLFQHYSWTWSASLGLALIAGVLCFVIRENRRDGDRARRVEDALIPVPAAAQ